MYRTAAISFTMSSKELWRSRAASMTSRVVERMASRVLDDEERAAFAMAALKIRYPNPERHVPITPGQVLMPRRGPDFGNTLWLTYNVLQENVIAGGLTGRAASGRSSRTRAIRAIREDIRINVSLWNEAMTLLEAR